jgi:hypothetical protein
MYIMFLFKNFYPKFTFFILKVYYLIVYHNKYSKRPVMKLISISIHFLIRSRYVEINNLLKKNQGGIFIKFHLN